MYIFQIQAVFSRKSKKKWGRNTAENKAIFETDFSPKTSSGNTILDFHIINC